MNIQRMDDAYSESLVRIMSKERMILSQMKHVKHKVTLTDQSFLTLQLNLVCPKRPCAIRS